MGNPPFVGYSLQSESQKSDILNLFVDEKGKVYKTAGKIDYVSGWYWKAAQLIKNTNIKCALVSTNSITQGEQVAALWKTLFERFDIHFDFAYRTFRWDSESTQKAHVHCVIIGFSNTRHSETSAEESNKKRDVSPSLNMTQKFIVNENGIKEEATNINGYLTDAPDIFIENRKKPLCNVPEMQKGSIPVDDGNFFFESDEYKEFIKKEPNAKKYIRRFYGAREFLHSEERWCLWLENISPKELKSMPNVMKRVENVRKFRLQSTKAATRKYADYAVRFMEIRQPETEYIIVPSHSSENRFYVPIGFEKPDIICGNANLIIPNATLYEFGILTSSVHMAWMRAVCGRLKSDYRYSNTIVYNNFPWPFSEKQTDLFASNDAHTKAKNVSSEQIRLLNQEKIQQTAKKILDARAKYPDCSLADLYDETVMPSELRKAHQANDRAVMAAYGFNPKMSESECVAELFKMYEKLTQKA